MTCSGCRREAWKDVPGYEGRYRVSDLGRVWSLHHGRVLTPKRSAHGYQAVTLCKGGAKRRFYIHRLVACSFLPKPGAECREVNHVDLNKANNRADNLQWVTHRENQRHAYENGRTDFRRPLRIDNKTGMAGVCPHGRGFQASLCHNGIRHYLGTYEGVEDAKAARAKAEGGLTVGEAS